MQPSVLINYFIRPACDYLVKYCPNCNGLNSIQMMLAIAAQETHCGLYFKQMGNGPARGIWQVEPKTSRDTYLNYIGYKNGLSELLEGMYSPILKAPHIQSPLYNCAIARLCLYRYPEAIPKLGDRDGMWTLYKKRYNSVLGKATKAEWNENWEQYVAPSVISEMPPSL